MKSYISVLAAILFLTAGITTAHAQSKIAWINSATIMDKLPEAQDAQRQLDNIVAEWQNELAKMQNDWQKKYEEYDKKKLILTDLLRAQSEKELQELDKKIAEYRTKKFGQNGELFTKQNELMKPIQNKIFKVVQEVAKEDDFDYVFDKSADIVMMYSNEKYDLTTKVLERITTFNK